MVDAAKVQELMAANASPSILMEELNMSTLESRFYAWWDTEGCETFARNFPEAPLEQVRELCKTAWLNGAYVQNRIKDARI